MSYVPPERIMTTANNTEMMSNLMTELKLVVRKKHRKEWRREWTAKNKDKLKAQMKEWQVKNMDKIVQKNKEWRERNPEKVKQNCASYREAHTEELTEYRVKRWEEKHQTYTCGCGSVIQHDPSPSGSKYKITRHEGSVKHKKWLSAE